MRMLFAAVVLLTFSLMTLGQDPRCKLPARHPCQTAEDVELGRRFSTNCDHGNVKVPACWCAELKRKYGLECKKPKRVRRK